MTLGDEKYAIPMNPININETPKVVSQIEFTVSPNMKIPHANDMRTLDEIEFDISFQKPIQIKLYESIINSI
jgi:hypothetical protein